MMCKNIMIYIGRKKEGEKRNYAVADTLEGLDKRPEPLSVSDVSPEALDKLVKYLNEEGYLSFNLSFERVPETRVSDGVGISDSWWYTVLSGEIDDTPGNSGPYSRKFGANVIVEEGYVEHHTIKPKADLAIVLQVKSTMRSEGIVYFLKKE